MPDEMQTMETGVETTGAADQTTQTETQTTQTGADTAAAGQGMEQAFAKRFSAERQKLEAEYAKQRDSIIAEIYGQHGINSYDQYQQAKAQAEAQAKAQEMNVDPKLYQEFRSLQDKVNSYERERTLSQDERVLSDKPFYKDWEKDIKSMADSLNTDLQTAYTILAEQKMPDILKQYEEKLKTAGDEAIKDYLAKKRAAPGITEGAGSTPVTEVKTPKTFDEARTGALAMLKHAMEQK